jgi:hypothetical protein
VKTAKKSVVFIDPYATVEVLKLAAMRAKGVSATIYSPRITPEFQTAAELHKKQYVTSAEVIEKIQESMKGR